MFKPEVPKLFGLRLQLGLAIIPGYPFGDVLVQVWSHLAGYPNAVYTNQELYILILTNHDALRDGIKSMTIKRNKVVEANYLKLLQKITKMVYFPQYLFSSSLH